MKTFFYILCIFYCVFLVNAKDILKESDYNIIPMSESYIPTFWKTDAFTNRLIRLNHGELIIFNSSNISVSYIKHYKNNASAILDKSKLFFPREGIYFHLKNSNYDNSSFNKDNSFIFEYVFFCDMKSVVHMYNELSIVNEKIKNAYISNANHENRTIEVLRSNFLFSHGFIYRYDHIHDYSNISWLICPFDIVFNYKCLYKDSFIEMIIYPFENDFKPIYIYLSIDKCLELENALKYISKLAIRK